MKKSFYLIALFCFAATLHAQVIQVDSSFGVNGAVFTQIRNFRTQPLIVQPDGKMVIMGYKGDLYSNPTGLMKRYERDGALDTSFQTLQMPKTEIQSGVMLQDGKYLCMTNNGVRRYLHNGAVDPEYILPPVDSLSIFRHIEMRELPNGKVVSCGNDEQYDGFAISVNHPDGTLDSGFAQNGVFYYHKTHTDLIFAIEPQPDGKILASGCSVDSFGFYVAVYRLNEDGTLDETFGNHGKLWDTAWEGTEGFGMDLQNDGKIVVSSYRIFSDNTSILFRYLPDGQRDLSFGVFGTCLLPDISIADDVVVLPNGKIIVMADTKTNGVVLIGLTADGILDPEFGVNGYYFPESPSSHIGNVGLHALDDHSIIATYYNGANANYGLILKRFLLDFNVGVLENNTENAWMVYPNPVSEQSRIKFSLQEAGEISFNLYDMNGKPLGNIIENQHFTTGEQEIALPINAALPAGNYMLAIRLNGKPAGGVQVLKL